MRGDVTRDDLERLLIRVREANGSPRGGLFGPGSRLWRYNREAVVFLGAGRASLLQTAHPYVARAIEEHSATKTDPLGRFVRTFDNVFAMVYGTLDEAIAAARRVHTYHTKITGHLDESAGPFAKNERYRANYIPALRWVHATLWDTSIQIYELLINPLSLREKNRYYDETKLFAYLFGIPDDELPKDWTDFRAYMDSMGAAGSDLAVTRAAREIAGFLCTPPDPKLAPFWQWYVNFTAGLLPPRIREEYGFAFGEAEERTFERSARALRWIVRGVPAPLRYVPPYNAAVARLEESPWAGVYGRFVKVLRSSMRRELSAKQPR